MQKDGLDRSHTRCGASIHPIQLTVHELAGMIAPYKPAGTVNSRPQIEPHPCVKNRGFAMPGEVDGRRSSA